jgi:hypothetical protein
MPIKDYRELIVWQKAMDLVVAAYRTTVRFPKEEVYGLDQPDSTGGGFGSVKHC